jgi:hypothetical protein
LLLEEVWLKAESQEDGGHEPAAGDGGLELV